MSRGSAVRGPRIPHEPRPTHSQAPGGAEQEAQAAPGEPGRRRPRKRFGQHFLERTWVDKLVRDVAAGPDESFIEIRPGRGALTLPLAASGARILAIDVDRDLAADLSAHAPPNISVVTADFLALSPGDLFGDARAHERFRVVGNLPYNVSSPILFRLLALARETDRLIDATLMLQREVADRVLAGPGSGDYGPLSVFTALHADAQRRFDLPPGAFRPPPKVHSTVVRLRFRPAVVDIGDYASFERIVRTIFQQRRKTIENALRPALSSSVPPLDAGTLLAAAAIDPRRRPETLSLLELASLTRTTLASASPAPRP